jgi:hypothetical protein
MTTTVRIPPSGDPFTARREPSTRHHRCTHEFIDLLEEDFGIPRHALINAFMGMTDDPARALLAWARKNRRGTFRPDESGDEE